jgi:hypothetical protein
MTWLAGAPGYQRLRRPLMITHQRNGTSALTDGVATQTIPLSPRPCSVRMRPVIHAPTHV